MAKVEKYQKLSPIEHVLQCSNMYIGSTSSEITNIFMPDDNNKLSKKLIEFNPGFYKIIDEILTNASDQSIRSNQVKYIKVTTTKDSISVENDGPGIPIEIHSKYKIYNPELIFANLLTGENFAKNEKRFVGGLHGIGAKATNIFSKKFIVETADGKNKYNQIFENNLSKINKPTITKSSNNYVKITFFPDFDKFGLIEIDDNINNIIKKRCFDISVYLPKVKVYFNDEIINIKSFKDYMSLYTDNIIYSEKINDEWEIGVSASIDDSFQQVSLVNCINTHVGGTHVNYITNQIIKGIKDDLQKKNKKINIKVNDIKNKLFVFINCKIPNPVFDTQTKENLSLKLTNDITNGVIVSEKLIKQLSQSDIVSDILNYIQLKEKLDLNKLNKGKTVKVKIKKLDDANFAGTNQSDKCALALTEGDSAKSFCISGFAETGRDYWGVFPLKGKPINVRGESIAKIKDNDEIKNIVSALGLEFGKKYTSTKDLRYGKLVLISDADCIDENTKIRTLRGDIMLKDITYEDKVLTHTGEYKQIINIISNNKNEYVEFEINGTILKFGLYHKLIVFRNGEYIEIFAKDLEYTDFLLLKKNCKNMTSDI